MNSLITKLSKVAKKNLKIEIADIVLFGSLIRGKENYTDIDILLLFKNKINKDIEYGIKKELMSINSKISIIAKTRKTLNDSSFSARDNIHFEGYSLINKSFLSAKRGFKSLGMFIYQTKNMKNTDKTRFYYAINGRRDNEGFFKTINAIKLSDNIITVPLENIAETRVFFKYWNIDFKYIPTLIPTRLAKKSIINKVW